MRHFSHFLGLFLIAVLCLFAMQAGFLRIFGINPNLLLAFFSSCLALKTKSGTLYALLFAICAASLAFLSFWIAEIAGMGIIIAVLIAFRKKLFGNPFADIAVVNIVGSILFWAFLFVFQGVHIIWTQIGYEILYTLLFGYIVFGIFVFLKKRTQLFE